MPLRRSCQIYPRIIPPIRFGIKNTVLNTLVPLKPFVKSSATVKARTLIRITDTTVKSAVYHNAWTKEGSVKILR